MTKDSYGYVSQGNPQTLNLYAYCGNNPVKFTDPNRHDVPGDEKLPGIIQDLISNLGAQWNKAKTQTEKDKIYNNANALRAIGKGAETTKVILGDSAAVLAIVALAVKSAPVMTALLIYSAGAAVIQTAEYILSPKKTSLSETICTDACVCVPGLRTAGAEIPKMAEITDFLFNSTIGNWYNAKGTAKTVDDFLLK